MNSLKKKYTVLLLSAPIGSGHRLAAQALEQVFAKEENVQVLHGNVFDFFPHCLGSAFLRSYLWILGCCPWLYAAAYKWGNRQGGSLWLRGLINRTLAFLGSGYLSSVQPDAVLATHATPAGIMSYYKRKHPDVFLGAVVTDFTIHQWWQCQGVDAYFLADERLCERISVPAEVLAYGIPVRQQFLGLDAQACRRQYGWDENERVCLLMGGGEGLLPMEEMLEALLHSGLEGLHLVAITGHNQKLEARLRAKYAKQNGLEQQAGVAYENSSRIEACDVKNIKTPEIYGFREDVPQMLAAADMIITKAGGLTSAEALASGLDLLIYKPLPGQEQGNAAFLRDFYGARIANDVPTLLEAVRGLCAAHRHMQAASTHGKPRAAEQICDFVMKKLAQK